MITSRAFHPRCARTSGASYANLTASVLSTWVGDTLAGFNLFILERDRVVGRYLGLRYPLAREHNLYFVNWLTMVIAKRMRAICGQ